MGPPPESESLAGWPPAPSLPWFSVLLLLGPPFPGVERERGASRAQRLQAHPAASLRCRALACFWKQWDVGIGAKQLILSAGLLWPAGEAAYTTLRRIFSGLCCTWEESFCWKTFPPSWLNGPSCNIYSHSYCTLTACPHPIESPSTWLGRLSFPGWPEVNVDGWAPKGTELVWSRSTRDLTWLSLECRP